MNRSHLPPDDSWETDAVWKLLDQVPPAGASRRFADDTLRAARLAKTGPAWWSRLASAAPWAGLAAAAAIAFAVIGNFSAPSAPEHRAAIEPTAPPEVLAELQDVAETETLILAVDHLDEFSDYELVSLIGF